MKPETGWACLIRVAWSRCVIFQVMQLLGGVLICERRIPLLEPNMTVDVNPENDANNEFYHVINQENNGSSQLSRLTMSPGISKLRKSNFVFVPPIGYRTFHDYEKDAEDKLTSVITNGPKIDKEPNKRKFTDNSEASFSDRKRICLDKDSDNQTQSLICPVCDESDFPSPHSFTLHIRKHNNIINQSNTCIICKKTLSSASSLDRHMLTHSGERPFVCIHCGTAFSTNGNMHRHMRTHGNKIDLSKYKLPTKRKATCGAESEPTIKKANVEEDQERKEQIMCPVCCKTFLCEYGLQNHMETHPDNPIRCPECCIILDNYHSFTKHQCLVNNSNNGNGNQLSTSEPFVGFYDIPEAVVGVSTNKFPLIAKFQCEQKIRQASSAFHKFDCKKCNKAFPCSRTLNQHKIGHLNKSGTYCPTCKCDFKTPEYLYEHLFKHRSAEHCFPENFAQQFETTKNDFLVLFGLKTTNFRNGFKTDLSCIKEEHFESLSYFLFGKPEEPSTLKEKNESEPNKSNLNNSDFADIQSIISLTSKAPLMPSIRCSPVTATPASPPQPQIASCQHPESPLLAISAQASPEIPQKEEFDLNCDKVLEINDNEEEKSDESNNIQKDSGDDKNNAQNKPFSCSKCKYSSFDKGTFKRHLRTHNNERPFQCITCQYAFTTKANCERHIKHRHKILKKEKIVRTMRYNPNMIENKDCEGQSAESSSETVCKYCNIDFKSKRVLRHHIRSVNNSCMKKPFLCKICNNRFSTKNNCIRHVAKQHTEMKDKANEVVSLTSNSDVSDQESTFCDANKESTEQPLNLSLRQSLMSGVEARYINEQQRYDDIVTAVTGLVSLSEVYPPVQTEPLDLSVRAIDLSAKPSVSYSCSNTTTMIKAKYSLSSTTETQISSVLSEYGMEKPSQEVKSSDKLSRPYICNYCPSGFTLKSNKDRHIKNKHPQFARPTRSRNYIPTVTTNIEKQNTSAVSTETRNALRYVLSNKLTSQTTSREHYTQAFNYTNSALTEVKDENSAACKGAFFIAEQSIERETAIDLASISDVIDTANCQQFKVFLNDARSENKLDVNKNKKIDKIDEKDDKNIPNSSDDNKTNRKKRSSYADSPNSIACPYCERTFPWSSSLRRHILTHTGQKPYKCPECPIFFTTKSNCERHFGRKHGTGSDFSSRSVPERPFKCNLCTSSTFSTQGNLRKHYYHKHRTKTGFEKDHILDLLSLSRFETDNSQNDETNCAITEAGHDGDDSQFSQPSIQEKTATFCCHLCHKRFQIKEEYFAHIQDHYNSDSYDLFQKDQEPSTFKHINCAFCPEIFDSMDHFSHHMVIHITNSRSSSSASHTSTDREFSETIASSSLRDRNRSPNSLLYLMQPIDTESDAETEAKAPETPQENEKGTDCLQSLLGLPNSTIEEMLVSPDSAAKVLGIEKQ